MAQKDFNIPNNWRFFCNELYTYNSGNLTINNDTIVNGNIYCNNITGVLSQESTFLGLYGRSLGDYPKTINTDSIETINLDDLIKTETNNTVSSGILFIGICNYANKDNGKIAIINYTYSGGDTPIIYSNDIFPSSHFTHSSENLEIRTDSVHNTIDIRVLELFGKNALINLPSDIYYG